MALADPTMTDAELVAACADVIGVPKAGPPDSFVLHAPLELLARAILLRRVPEAVRPRARARLSWLADRYWASGPDAAPDGSPLPHVDDVVVSLAAAGHAPILLALRARVPQVGGSFGDALVASSLARHPDWRVRWVERREEGSSLSGDLEACLAGPPSAGDPGSDFIYPTMHLVDEGGLAAAVLDGPLRGLGPDDTRRILLRTAARSMLQDDPAAAPYGWTHCLTMPQAVLEAVDLGADAELAVAVAATYVLGFRSTKGRVTLDPGWVPAAGSSVHRAWSARGDERDAVVDDLVAFGAVHPDAHVAKYTLAGLDAAAADPEAAHLHLAAIAHLHEWWRAHPVEDDPLWLDHLAAGGR